MMLQNYLNNWLFYNCIIKLALNYLLRIVLAHPACSKEEGSETFFKSSPLGKGLGETFNLCFLNIYEY